MKTVLHSIYALAGFVCLTGGGLAQEQPPPEGRGGPRGPSGFLRSLPVMAALDADADGQLSDKEIENASAALKALDKDKDGKLAEAELLR